MGEIYDAVISWHLFKKVDKFHEISWKFPNFTKFTNPTNAFETTGRKKYSILKHFFQYANKIR